MDDEITTAEAAKMLGLSVDQIQWYFRKGLLKGRRIGMRLLVFRRADVEGFKKPKRTGRPPKSSRKNEKPAKKVKRKAE
jgi:excisionase family DNA binding protein